MADQTPQDLEAADWIGKTVSCLSNIDASNIDALLSSSPDGGLALALSNTPHTVPVTFTIDSTNQNRSFKCPDNITVRRDVSSTNQLQVFDSGSKATQFLEADASASASYGGLSVSGNTKYSSHSSFSDNSMYALYSWEETCYRANLSVLPQTVVHPQLINAATALPPWDQNNADVVQSYQDFFSSNGTHAITAAKYGWRYLLRVSCDKSNADVDNSFEACVKAEYSGVGSMSASADIKSGNTYSSYFNKSQASCYVRGGDLTANADVQDSSDRKTTNDPGPVFTKWVGSTAKGTGEQMLSVTVIGIPDILRQNAPTKQAAASLTQALAFLTAQTRQHTFSGLLSGRSDWLEFKLDNPPPTTSIVVPNPVPTPNGNGPRPFRLNFYNAGGVNMRADGDPSWRFVGNYSIPFTLKMANAFDPVSFSLNHGAAGGSSDDDHFSRVQFFGDDGVTQILMKDNFNHQDSNEMVFSNVQIQPKP